MKTFRSFNLQMQVYRETAKEKKIYCQMFSSNYVLSTRFNWMEKVQTSDSVISETAQLIVWKWWGMKKLGQNYFSL